MKNLWTPWRMSYILGNEARDSACIFDITGNCLFDREKLILYRDEHSLVLLNRFPYANGHLLVAPARHLAELTELDDTEAHRLMDMLRKSTAILKKHLKPDGFNIGLNLGETAGAGLADHLHFHIVPRWDGDHNFMATVAGIRLIPEELDQTFCRLLEDFQALTETEPISACRP
ncbi:MAG: HIT domain-containing protein [Desulfurivibrionaceae bacterium]